MKQFNSVMLNCGRRIDNVCVAMMQLNLFIAASVFCVLIIAIEMR